MSVFHTSRLLTVGTTTTSICSKTVTTCWCLVCRMPRQFWLEIYRLFRGSRNWSKCCAIRKALTRLCLMMRWLRRSSTGSTIGQSIVRPCLLITLMSRSRLRMGVVVSGNNAVLEVRAAINKCSSTLVGAKMLILMSWALSWIVAMKTNSSSSHSSSSASVVKNHHFPLMTVWAWTNRIYLMTRLSKRRARLTCLTRIWRSSFFSLTVQTP